MFFFPFQFHTHDIRPTGRSAVVPSLAHRSARIQSFGRKQKDLIPEDEGKMRVRRLRARAEGRFQMAAASHELARRRDHAARRPRSPTVGGVRPSRRTPVYAFGRRRGMRSRIGGFVIKIPDIHGKLRTGLLTTKSRGRARPPLFPSSTHYPRSNADRVAARRSARGQAATAAGDGSVKPL